MWWRWKAAGGVLMTLLFWEIVVRLCVVSPAKINHDPELGPMKAAYVDVLRTYEGFSRFTTDAYGFNNDALPMHLPAQRLLILGDSFVEAEQVNRTDNFVARLNALPRVLAYNAGISGIDPRAFSVLLARFQPILHPTRLILCVNGGDLSALTSTRLPHDDAPTGVKRWLQPLFAHSALMTHLNWKYKSEWVAWWQKLRGVQDEVKHTEADVVSQKKIQRNLLNWQQLLSLWKQQGVPMLLLVMPAISYTPNGVVILDSPEADAMADVAKKLGVDVLRLEQAFADDFRQSGRVALGFSNSHLGSGHLNAQGHRIVADLLRDHLVHHP